jgi:hypothetical protein
VSIDWKKRPEKQVETVNWGNVSNIARAYSNATGKEVSVRRFYWLECADAKCSNQAVCLVHNTGPGATAYCHECLLYLSEFEKLLKGH